MAFNIPLKQTFLSTSFISITILSYTIYLVERLRTIVYGANIAEKRSSSII